MNPNIEDIEEPGIGRIVYERGVEYHSWHRRADGLWYCNCNLGWIWEEVVDDIGPKNNNYYIEEGP